MKGIATCITLLLTYSHLCKSQDVQQIIARNLNFDAQPDPASSKNRLPNAPDDKSPGPSGTLLKPQIQRTLKNTFDLNAIDRRAAENRNDGIRALRRVGKASLGDKYTLSDLKSAAQRSMKLFLSGSSIKVSPFISTAQFASNCPFNKVSRCKPNWPWRAADGSCNNLRYPSIGMSKTPFSRLVRARYEDGVSEPRRSFFHTRDFMHSARTVSVHVHKETSKLSNKNTHMLMGFGQFLDHDLTLTASAAEGEGGGSACCAEEVDGRTNPSLQAVLNERPECFPILVESKDPVFKTECMSFLRSIAAPNSRCTPDTRQQLNDLTAYLDSSNIYGNNQAATNRLRDHRGGRMKVQTLHGKDHLPYHPDNDASCTRGNAPDFCSFDAGDSRNSEQAGLTAQHTLWVRFHNKIAERLSDLNSKWKDEQLFQTTRKIIIAIWQRIIYKEWLPHILGDSLMRKWGLKVSEHSYTSHYAPQLDVSIMNVFATAVFRFGHSLVREKFSKFDENHNNLGELDISDMFHGVRTIQSEGADAMIIGQLQDKAEKLDRFCTPKLRNSLFNSQLDLMALNIQRGRDHGLGSYMDYRRVIKLRAAKNWNELRSTHSASTISALKKVYPHVEDLEIWPAGLSEKAVRGGLIGPLFGNIMGFQFSKLKYADRFWHERQDRITGFEKDQLQEIRKVTMASIFCLVTDVTEIQPDVFLLPSGRNSMVPCRRMHTLDLTKWRIKGSTSLPSQSDEKCKWGAWGDWTRCRRSRQRRARQCYDANSSRSTRCASSECSGSRIQVQRCRGSSRSRRRRGRLQRRF